MTLVERIAAWASALDVDDISHDVAELLAAQRRSVIGAMGASTQLEAARAVIAGYTSARSALDEEAKLYAAAVLSVALDFDDYLCFGHTGHSAVLASFLVDVSRGGADDRVAAQLIANEVGARLGGACLLGPLNGQLWSFIHAAEGALAAARVIGLDAVRTAHALAIALYQAPRPVVPGFMGADSKLLTVADPLVVGVRSARLAQAGASGPLDVLDHPHGFFRAFSYVPIRGFFDSLGDAWAMHSLSIKPYPGCAYVDAAVDALASLGPPSVEEISGVRIDGGLLTCGMESMSSPYSARLDAVTVNFSARTSAAVLLLAGELTPNQMTQGYLSAHRAEITDLVGRIHLRHDWRLTGRGAHEFVTVVPPAALRREISLRTLGRAVRRMRRDHPTVQVGWRDLRGLAAGLRPRGKSLETSRLFDRDALRRFRMTLPARVSVSFRDGRVAEAERMIPRGAAGHATYPPGRAGRDKFERWAVALAGDGMATKLDGAVDEPAADLPGLLDETLSAFVERCR